MTDSPGGSTFVRRPGFGASMSGGVDFWRNSTERNDERDMGYQLADNVDGQKRPPQWIETKKFDVLGRETTIEERGENYWETRYAKELMIGELRQQQRLEDFTMETHDVIGTARTIMRKLGLWAPAKSKEDLYEMADRKYEERQRVAKVEHEKRKLDWNAFVSALESDKPLVNVAKDYRNVYDCYGIDECLDSSLALIWLAFKCGGCIGIFQGGFRALKTLHVDAAFLKASGIGVMTFANVSIGAGFLKWAGNLTAASTMFVLGDRLVTQAKYLTMPEGAQPVRTPINYTIGMGMAFGVVGVMPWWFLNDAAMGLRLAASSSIVGGIVGYGAGVGVQRLIALNLSRLDYTPAQFRAYQAVMKREKMHVEEEIARLKRDTRNSPSNGAKNLSLIS